MFEEIKAYPAISFLLEYALKSEAISPYLDKKIQKSERSRLVTKTSFRVPILTFTRFLQCGKYGMLHLRCLPLVHSSRFFPKFRDSSRRTYFSNHDCFPVLLIARGPSLITLLSGMLPLSAIVATNGSAIHSEA